MNGPLFSFVPPQQAERPYTVSEINEGVALLLESGNALVWVEGEISNWRSSSSGHTYFRLKDAESQVPAVLWRSAAEKLAFVPEDGLAVFAIASIRVYRKGGYYQLDVHRMEPRGKGALFAAFEHLKKKLEQEGLFDPAHKIPLPASIQRLGIVTSKHGAAIKDIVRVTASRAPQTDIVLIDVPVQGEMAAPKIASALRDLDATRCVDCIIVGRGGGSVEDLWPFNEEIVARAIYDCETAVVSAVGHEIDFTIADFVADVRAPTPSAAAEIVLPDRAESRRYFDTCAARFAAAASRYFSQVNDRFARSASSRSLRRPLELLADRQQELDGYSTALRRRMGETIRTASRRFAHATGRLNSLSPLAVLARGYGVISTAEGKTVRIAGDLSPGQDIALRFKQGSATATVDTVVP